MTKRGTIFAAAAVLALCGTDGAGAEDGASLLLQHTPAADWASLNVHASQEASPPALAPQAPPPAPAVAPTTDTSPAGTAPPAAKGKRLVIDLLPHVPRPGRKRAAVARIGDGAEQGAEKPKRHAEGPYGRLSSGTTYVAETVPEQQEVKEPINPIACLFDSTCLAHVFAVPPPVPEAPPPWPQADGAAPPGTPPSVRDLVAKHAAENGIPFRLADAVIRIESGSNARSVHAGNYGLMQIRPATARSLGFAGAPAGLLDPDTNLRFGMKYLGQAYRIAKGDTCLALMRYQSGLGTLRQSAANRTYCARARSFMAGL